MSQQQQPQNILTAGEHAAIVRWSNYGQKGVTPQQRVMSWDWQTQDFVSPRSAPWDLPLHVHQLPVLLLGFCPGKSQADVMNAEEDMIVGDRMLTHGFMSTSKNPAVKATEDKWFIYAVGPDARGSVSVHMHRSWTGQKVLELGIDAGRIGAEEEVEEQLEGGWAPAKVTSITWEPDTFAITSAERAKEEAREICQWILNVDLGME